MAEEFPRADLIANPTVKYNCHSYAWYMQSTSNPYWMPEADAYTTDGSYTKYSGTPRSGMRAFYKNGIHTAISIGTEVVDGSQVHKVESKWGPSGLYEHAYSYGPYGGTVTWYTN